MSESNVGDLLDPNVKWHGGDPTAEGSCKNREQALTFMRQAEVRDGPIELVDVVGSGDKVVVILRPREWRRTHRTRREPAAELFAKPFCKQFR